jgi:chromosome segregation ATPase
MNIESSRVEDVSIEQKFENLSVLKRPDESDDIMSKKETKLQDSSRYDNSQMTSNRSHFTSIDGPPKVYEDIMRQLEADIRKHIRIEHQLKLHIESVEDRVEELEREQEQLLKKIKTLEPSKQQALTAKKELKLVEEVLKVKTELSEK